MHCLDVIKRKNRYSIREAVPNDIVKQFKLLQDEQKHLAKIREIARLAQEKNK